MGIALENKFRADLVLCYTAKAMLYWRVINFRRLPLIKYVATEENESSKMSMDRERFSTRNIVMTSLSCFRDREYVSLCTSDTKSL